MSDNGLTARQRKAIPAMLTETTIKEAAKAAGIGERTLYRWLQEDLAFQQALRAAQDQVVSGAIARMSSGVGDAVDTLLTIINDADERGSTRVNAARILLSEYRALREGHELAERVSNLEIRLTWGDNDAAINTCQASR